LLEDSTQGHLASVEVEHHALRESAVVGGQHRLRTNRLEGRRVVLAWDSTEHRP
jgi:hypothetical protein